MVEGKAPTFSPLSCSCVNLSVMSAPQFKGRNWHFWERSSLSEPAGQVPPLQTQLTHPSDGAAPWTPSRVCDRSTNLAFWACAHFNRSACVWVWVHTHVYVCVCYLVRVGPECWNGEFSLDPAFSNGIRCIPHRVTLRASIHLQAVRTNTHTHNIFTKYLFIRYILFITWVKFNSSSD